jgi:hypothetical protein
MMLKCDSPFLSGRDTAHAMKLVQDSLQACQNSTIQRDGEGPFETRFMLRLSKQPLKLDQLDLQM